VLAVALEQDGASGSRLVASPRAGAMISNQGLVCLAVIAQSLERPSKRLESLLPRFRGSMPRPLQGAHQPALVSVVGGDEAIALSRNTRMPAPLANAGLTIGDLLPARPADRFVVVLSRNTSHQAGSAPRLRPAPASASIRQLRSEGIELNQARGGEATQEGLGGVVERVVGPFDAKPLTRNNLVSAPQFWEVSLADRSPSKKSSWHLQAMAAQKGNFAQDADRGRSHRDVSSAQGAVVW